MRRRPPPAGGRVIGIFTALPEELAPLLAAAADVAPAGPGLWRGRIADAEILVGATGEGAARAEERARDWLRAFPVFALVGTGIAGGLSPALRRGHVIAAREVRSGGGETWVADAELLARAESRADHVGVVVSTRRPCFTSAEKGAMLDRHRGPAPLAADVESSGWARAASESEIPFLAIRAVLDEADEDLPEGVRDAWSADGVDRSRVVGGALRRPREIAPLLRLRRRTLDAMRAIARILPAVLPAEA